MLTSDEIKDSTDNVDSLYSGLSEELILSMVAYLAVLDLNKKTRRAKLIGELGKKAEKIISKYQSKIIKEIAILYVNSGKLSISRDIEILTKKIAVKEVVPAAEAKLPILKTSMLNSIADSNNLTHTTANSVISNFANIVSDAYREVAKGANVEDVVDKATKKIIDRGFSKIDYKSGYRINTRSAVDMNIRTALKQSTVQMTIETGEELGWNSFQVSSHSGCAPDHYWIQGEIITLGTKKYEDVITAMQRPNCRHSLSPYLRGYSSQNKVYQTKAQSDAQYKKEQEANRKKNYLDKKKLERETK